MVYLGTVRKGKRGELVYRKGTEKVRGDDFTLIICFSRLWCFRKFFESFERMTIDLEHCHLLLFDNSDNIALRDALLGRAREYSSHFRSVRLYKSWRLYQRPLLTAKVIEWKDSQNGPILGMHIDAMRLCETDKFVMIEDDTLCPRDAVPRLLSTLDDRAGCGMVTAVQPMRQSSAFMVTYPGVYYCKVDDGRVVETVTPSENLKGLHRVDGSGWYCFASYKRLFSLTTKMLLEVEDKARNYAVDVLGVSFFRDLGYYVLADFGLWCGHYTKLDGVDFIWTKLQCRPMISRWCPEWHVSLRATNVSESVHYKLLRRLTRRKDGN